MSTPRPQTIAERPAGSIAGYRVLVVGASSGIGRAVVDLLAESGATVAACDLPGATWPTDEPGESVTRFPIDVTDVESVEAAVRSAVADLGGLDAVVNCAGFLGSVVPAAEEPMEQIERLLRVNLLGAFAVSRAVLPVMAANGFGRLVHVASMAGKDGNPQMTGYSASKAGVIGMVKALGKEYADTGVTVNAIAPASIETPLIAGMTPERQEVQRRLVPMGRFGTPAEAAALIRYVISPEASFTTGFVHDLSGGRATY
jgi:NAD(P)-dependent dehydrogenase (short-subunit alcohol dehydrogenase family)